MSIRGKTFAFASKQRPQVSKFVENIRGLNKSRENRKSLAFKRFVLYGI